MKCPKCGSDNCIGFYLLHPKELCEVDRLKETQIKENPNAKFRLIRSTNKDGTSDGLYTKFEELHIIVEHQDN